MLSPWGTAPVGLVNTLRSSQKVVGGGDPGGSEKEKKELDSLEDLPIVFCAETE